MAAWKTSCPVKGCNGVPMALNDGAARISEVYFGRVHYKCDTCGTRLSVDPKEYLERTDRFLKKR